MFLFVCLLVLLFSFKPRTRGSNLSMSDLPIILTYGPVENRLNDSFVFFFTFYQPFVVYSKPNPILTCKRSLTVPSVSQEITHLSIERNRRYTIDKHPKTHLRVDTSRVNLIRRKYIGS